MLLRKVISGGQTGVDRAGLDAAREAGIPTGGYCAKGRLAEDGTIPASYPVSELEFHFSSVRTKKNVVASDGTLILNKGDLTGGTFLTQEFAAKHGKPFLVVQLDAKKVIKQEQVLGWLTEQQIRVLNIAGPRESKSPSGIYNEARLYLHKLFTLDKDQS